MSVPAIKVIFQWRFKLVELEQMQLVDFFLIFIYQDLCKKIKTVEQQMRRLRMQHSNCSIF